MYLQQRKHILILTQSKSNGVFHNAFSQGELECSSKALEHTQTGADCGPVDPEHAQISSRESRALVEPQAEFECVTLTEKGEFECVTLTEQGEFECVNTEQGELECVTQDELECVTYRTGWVWVFCYTG